MRLRLPPSVRFGRGTLPGLADALAECGVRRALVVTDNGVVAAGATARAGAVVSSAGVPYSVFDAVRPNPCAAAVEQCRDALVDGDCDGIVAVGGGSVLDVAKATVAQQAAGVPLTELYGVGQVRAASAVPVIAVPTTPGSGSEVSSHAVIADDRSAAKHAVSGPCLVPRAAVIDPDLSDSLSIDATVHCGLDALMHAVEAYLAVAATPFSDAMALPAIGLIASSLPAVTAGDRDARSTLSLGCLHGNLAMANANAGLVHALGYPLTTRFGVPHGLANALVAPAVLSASRPAHPDRDATAASGLPGGPRLADGIRRLLSEVRVPVGLRSHGVAPSDVDALADASLHYGPVRRNWRFRASRDDIVAMYLAAL